MIRDRTFHEYRILNTIKENKGITTTELMKKMDLGWSHTGRYVVFFKEKGLLKTYESDNKLEKPLRITRKGLKLLHCLKNVAELNH